MKKGLFLSMLPIGVANNIAPVLAKSVTALRDIYIVSGFPECSVIPMRYQCYKKLGFVSAWLKRRSGKLHHSFNISEMGLIMEKWQR